jgi:hypothetical protein
MAGSRPTQAELATIPRLGEVRPRIITGAATPVAKRESMQRDIAISQQGQKIRRNRRAIAQDAAAIRKSPPAVASHDEWRDGRSFSDLNRELCAFIKRADWWGILSELTQENLIDMFWRQYAKGNISLRAWRLEVENVRLEVVGAPRSIEEQRADTIREQQCARRYDYSHRLPGGW